MQHALDRRPGLLRSAVKIQSGGGVAVRRGPCRGPAGRRGGAGGGRLACGVSRPDGGGRPGWPAVWALTVHLALALDVKVGRTASRCRALKGWTEAANVDLWAALDRHPVGNARCADHRCGPGDGALTGPNLELLAEVVRRRPDPRSTASRRVSSIEDILAAR